MISTEYFHSGDLKLVEKPQPVIMGPNDFTNIKACVKVASTENGIIFGNIGMIFAQLPSFDFNIAFLKFTMSVEPPVTATVSC